MIHVDWAPILAGRGTVDFSSLEIPEARDEFERDVAQIRLRGGSIIDIGWDFDKAKYVITVFRDTFENPSNEVECSTASDVVEWVKRLIDEDEADIPMHSGASRNTPPVARYEYA
jgi:hypothetical protein